MGRAYLEAGRLQEAEEHLRFAYRAQLFPGGPDSAPRLSLLTRLLARFYLGKARGKERPQGGGWAASRRCRWSRRRRRGH